MGADHFRQLRWVERLGGDLDDGLRLELERPEDVDLLLQELRHQRRRLRDRRVQTLQQHPIACRGPGVGITAREALWPNAKWGLFLFVAAGR